MSDVIALNQNEKAKMNPLAVAPAGVTETARFIRVGLEGQFHGKDLLDGGKSLPADDHIYRRAA